jgi:hypothetical protein
VNVSFIGVPPRDVRLADQREMPVADLPPAQIRVPDHAEIEPLDVTIADAGGHLHAELVSLGRDRRTQEQNGERDF